MPVTLRQIAQVAGVSEGTVSRALGGSACVREATRHRIELVSRQLGYRPNAQARTLATGALRSVGAVVAAEDPRTISHTLAAVGLLEPLHAELGQRGLNLVLTLEPVVAQVSGGKVDLPTMVTERHTAGVVIIGHMTETLAEHLQRLDLPFVVLNARRVNGACTVNVREEQTTEALVHHLAALGHRRIAFVNGDHDNGFRTRLRPMGYARAMGEEGLPLFPGWDELRVAEAAFERLWKCPSPPTAVITADDATAARLVQFLGQRGRRVPADVSVASAHAHSFGELLPTRFTRMLRPNAAMAKAVVEAMAALIAGDSDKAASRQFDSELEIGGSTAPPPEESDETPARRRASSWVSAVSDVDAGKKGG